MKKENNEREKSSSETHPGLDWSLLLGVALLRVSLLRVVLLLLLLGSLLVSSET